MYVWALHLKKKLTYIVNSYTKLYLGSIQIRIHMQYSYFFHYIDSFHLEMEEEIALNDWECVISFFS